MADPGALPLGALCPGGGRCAFRVWAPRAARVEVRLLAPEERTLPLAPEGGGYHGALAEGVPAGALYLYRLDGGRELPDPASRSQPRGVHGPSEVVDPAFPWTDGGWAGLPIEDYLLYEVHAGTFTAEGTLGAIIPRLDELRELGATALELMPLAQFPGGRNWGYDGAFPWAVQDTYGGPLALKRLVDACHRRGMAAVLDVVYNHAGPEGNPLAEFSPRYFSRRRTPWGPALNFDGPGSREVRRFFIGSARRWIEEFHLDALRLDAVHAIRDASSPSFLEELGEEVHALGRALGRRVYLFPEDNRNDPRLVTPREAGGQGLDAVWTDDFHHAVHALLAGEREGYYADFGRVENVAQALREGFVLAGQWSRYRKRRHGRSSRGVAACRHIAFIQNHDQAGNRPGGERLGALVPFEKLKLAAGLLLLSPYLPLLFMGEEYGERAPFLYFTSHSGPSLIEAVERGRREGLRAFGWKGEPPRPQDEETFRRSKLAPPGGRDARQRALREFYRALIRLRRETPALALLSKDHLDASILAGGQALFLRRWTGGQEACALFHFGESPAPLRLSLPPGKWAKALDSAEERWLGPGSPLPGAIESKGEAEASAAPWSVAVWVRG